MSDDKDTQRGVLDLTGVSLWLDSYVLSTARGHRSQDHSDGDLRKNGQRLDTREITTLIHLLPFVFCL